MSGSLPRPVLRNESALQPRLSGKRRLPGPAKQLQQTVGKTDYQPLRIHVLKPPQQESPETTGLLDLADCRLGNLFTGDFGDILLGDFGDILLISFRQGRTDILDHRE